MPIVASRKITAIAQSTNPKVDILDAVGDLSKVTVLGDWVLVAIYIRPEKTSGGIIRPDANVQEDEWQQKIGLVLLKGPGAKAEWESDDMKGQSIVEMDWALCPVNDGLPFHLNGYPCRLIRYDRIRMRVDEPDSIF